MGVRQVWEEMLLYENSRSDTLFLVHREPGRLYQKDHRLDGRLHVFVGMHMYATVAGASRTVPVFKKVEL